MPNSPDFPPRFSVQLYARDVAFNADASLLYVAGEGEVLAFPREGKPVSFSGVRARALAASPTAALVACAGDRAIALCDARGKRLRSTPLSKGVDVAQGIAFSPAGSSFAVGTGHLNSAKTTVEIFSADGKRLRVIEDDRGFGIAQVAQQSIGEPDRLAMMRVIQRLQVSQLGSRRLGRGHDTTTAMSA